MDQHDGQAAARARALDREIRRPTGTEMLAACVVHGCNLDQALYSRSVTVIDVRRAAARYRTDAGQIQTWHAFSFGAHYDPDNTHFGPLLACNVELIAPGAGYEPHPHRDTDIVTWVLDGVLTHEDSTGRTATVTAGDGQWLRAGSGVRHAERNAGPHPLRFLQMWLKPEAAGLAPRYERIDVARAADAHLLALVSDRSGRHPAVRTTRPGATLWLARLSDGAAADLPPAPRRHVVVTSGAADLDGTALALDDTARVLDAGAQRVSAAGPAELLIWDLPAD